MIPRSFGLALLVCLSLAPAVGGAQLVGGSQTIAVSGEADVRVTPDEVVLTVGVETFDQALAAATQANGDRIRATIDQARELGVSAAAIQTDYISIEPRYDRGDVTRTRLGFVVRKSVVIRLADLAKFERLLAGVLEAGVTHVQGIEFRTTELRRHRDQARVLAVRAAQEKADLLARESARRRGATLSIGEASYGYVSSYGARWGHRSSGAAQNVMQTVAGEGGNDDRTVAPGQIAIRARVSMSFALE